MTVDLSQLLEGSEASLIHYHEVISHLDRQREDVRTELRDSKAEIAHLKAVLEAARLMAEFGRVQMLESVNEYLEGYKEALLHIWTLFPGIDLQPCKPYMRVEGSPLVNPIKEVRTVALGRTPKIEVNRAEESVTDDAEA